MGDMGRCGTILGRFWAKSLVNPQGAQDRLGKAGEEAPDSHTTGSSYDAPMSWLFACPLLSCPQRTRLYTCLNRKKECELLYAPGTCTVTDDNRRQQASTRAARADTEQELPLEFRRLEPCGRAENLPSAVVLSSHVTALLPTQGSTLSQVLTLTANLFRFSSLL